MMRKQGSLYLAASLCEEMEGAGHERAATSRLTLALRHYARALAPSLLAQVLYSYFVQLYSYFLQLYSYFAQVALLERASAGSTAVRVLFQTTPP